MASDPSPNLEFRFAPIYQYSTTLVEPPTGNQFRFDAGPPYDTVSKLWIRFTSSNNTDHYHSWKRTPITSELFFQDQNDHTRYVAVRVSVAPIEKAEYFEFGIVPIDTSGIAFANNQDVLIACYVPSKALPIPAPVITSVAPTTAEVGTAIAIDGHDFGADQGSSTVTVNGIPATADLWTETRLVAPVPAGVPAGIVVLTVLTSDGGPSNGVTLTVTPAPATPEAPPTTPLDNAHVVITTPLIPLADAKVRLRVTDTTHDTEIAREVLIAQNVILDYLKKGADPAWTEATLPWPVRAAIEDMLTHRYEHRGDDMSPTQSGATPDADVWEAIDRKLARFRDPALA